MEKIKQNKIKEFTHTFFFHPINLLLLYLLLFWGDVIIYPRLLEHKLKNPDNIRQGCLYYDGYMKDKYGSVKNIFFKLNDKTYKDSNIIPYPLFPVPSNGEYLGIRDKIFNEQNKQKCYYIEYVEVFWFPIFFSGIQVYDFKDF